MSAEARACNNKTRAHAKVMVAGAVVLISAWGSFAYGQLLPIKCHPKALKFQKEVARVIPDVTGCMYDDVEAALRSLELPAQAVIESSDRPKGTILSQVPSSGASAASSHTMELHVSGGPGIAPEDDVSLAGHPSSDVSVAASAADDPGPQATPTTAEPDLTNNSAAVSGSVEHEAGEGDMGNNAQAGAAEPDPNQADNSSATLTPASPPASADVSVAANAGPIDPPGTAQQQMAAGERPPPGASNAPTASWSLAWLAILAAGVIAGMTGLGKLLWPPRISPSLSADVSMPDWPNAPTETAPGMSIDAHLEIAEVGSEFSVPILEEAHHD